MSAQQERPREKNIVYELQATQALEVARERAHTEGRKVVSFQYLVEGINSQIPRKEKPNMYYDYGIDEFHLKLSTLLTITAELPELWRLEETHRTDTEPQSLPRVQRAIQYAEEFAALKRDRRLDIHDLFRGAVKVTEVEYTAHNASFLNRTL